MNLDWGQNLNRDNMPADTGVGNARYDEQLEIYKTLDGIPIWRNGDSMLRQAFAAYGGIQHLFFKDLTSVNKPSFAFVTYFDPRHAAQAIKCRNMIILGNKKLFVTPADSWHQPHENEDGTITWDRKALGYVPLAIVKPQEPETESDETDAKTVEQEEVSPISNFNSDCLEIIFSYLSLRERVVVGQVCRSWRDLNSRYWRSIKRLDFSKPPFDSVKLDDKQLKYFLEHCPKVSHLNIARRNNELTSESIVAIAKHCPNLVEIKIKDSELLKNRCCALLGEYCRKLTSFRCDCCSKSTFDHEFLGFLKKATRLEKLYLKDVAKSSLWMVQMNPPLKSLTLDHFCMKSDVFIEAIDRIKNTLTELKIIYPADQYLYMSHVTETLKKCQKLTSVTLNAILQVVPNDSSSLNPLGDLKYLKHLNLNRNMLVSDGLLKIIAERCTGLERFSFCGLDNNFVTATGLKFVRSLTNLKYLSLASHYFMTDDLIDEITKKLSKLEYLCIMSCSKITDSGCLKVLKNCKELAIIDVCDCESVNASFVFDEFEDRKSGNRKQLTIIASGWKFKGKKIICFLDTDRMRLTMLQEVRKIVKVPRKSLENPSAHPDHAPNFPVYVIDEEGHDMDYESDESDVIGDGSDFDLWEDEKENNLMIYGERPRQR